MSVPEATAGASLAPVPPAGSILAHGSSPIAPARCANCGAPIAARYCAECGQRVEHAAHSLGHFLREAAEDLTHADSRLWRTLLALLLRPGYLTCEFRAGRRVRYLPPVRLYLVLSVAFFLLAGLGRGSPPISVMATGQDSPSALQNASGATRARLAADRCGRIDIEGPIARVLDPSKVRSACRDIILDDGHSLSEALTHNLARALFVFLPLMAAIMKLLYRRRFYVEHLLFLLHNHAFVFLLFGLCGVLALTPAARAVGTLEEAAALYTVWYLFRAMRRVYSESRMRTAAKFGFLALSYAACAVIMLALTAVYSVVTLGPAG